MRWVFYVLYDIKSCPCPCGTNFIKRIGSCAENIFDSIYEILRPQLESIASEAYYVFAYHLRETMDAYAI